MFVQSGVVKAGHNQSRTHAAHPEGVAQVQPQTITIPIYPIILLAACLILCISLVTTVARTGQAPAVVEPPQRYLPGTVLPVGAYCKVSAEGYCYPPMDAHCNVPGDGRCFTYRSYNGEAIGKKVYLTVEIATGAIIQALIPATEYTVGDLMLAWGTPIGFSRSGRAITVYWNKRSAYLTTCSFRPESHVTWITYFSESVEASPWHGFNQRIGAKC